ncbi:MAG: hypothetical protein U0Z26_01605 [Anaerolineales bacterium]
MSDILRLLVIVLLLTVSLTAYFLVVSVLFPQRTIKTKNTSQLMTGRSFGIGLVNLLFFTLIAFVLISISDKVNNGFVKGILTIPAFLILAMLAIMLSFGLTGVSITIGESLFPELVTWKQTLWGSVLLCFACALPFVGWFLLLPYAGFTGAGAFILGLFQREPKV